MQNSIEILKRDSLNEGGFAGLKEHHLVKSPELFGPHENNDGSWPGLGNFVYLADARFMPHGETRMHGHHEIDVISVMVEGRISHEGSLQHGQSLSKNDVQVQRAGGENNSETDFPAKTILDVAVLKNKQQIEVDKPFIAYVARGKGMTNNKSVEQGDLLRGESLQFEALNDVQLVVIHAG